MKILSSCSVPTIGESVTLSLAHGDLLSEVTTNDTVVASVFKRSYDTGFFQGTFIGALEDKYKIRFEELSKSPKIDFRSGLSTWATIVDAGPTVIVIEFAPEIDLTETFLNLAVSLEVMLRKRWLPTPARVLMPILGLRESLSRRLRQYCCGQHRRDLPSSLGSSRSLLWIENLFESKNFKHHGTRF